MNALFAIEAIAETTTFVSLKMLSMGCHRRSF